MAKATPKFAGLTDEQVLRILGQIATTANLISGVCQDRADHYGGHDSETDFHAIDTMIRGLGALADLPTGGNSVGDFAAWMCGPLFGDEGYVTHVQGGAV